MANDTGARTPAPSSWHWPRCYCMVSTGPKALDCEKERLFRYEVLQVLGNTTVRAQPSEQASSILLA